MGTICRCDSRNELELGYINVNINDPAAEAEISSQHEMKCNDGEGPVACDYFGGVYEYIKQMLMEEDDLDQRPCMFQDCSALQAAEKYFHDALSENHDSLFNPQCDFTEHQISTTSQTAPAGAPVSAPLKKTHGRGDINNNIVNGGEEEQRSSKQFAGYADHQDSVQMDKYDKSLLCPKMNPGFYDDDNVVVDEDSPETSDSEEESKKQYRKTMVVKRGRPKGSKKNRKVSQVVDLRSLLTRCAEAVSTFNIAAADNLLKQIRDHSSPYGDANERLAHCFANALEARMTATGSSLYTALTTRRIAAADLLRSYQSYVTACPFKRMSNIFANKSIGKFTREATKVHIIDFGILYGFQWPCIIQGLSLKPGGAPMLKITGIDYPQPGFKPAERVEQTGRRLMDYCKRFNLRFEYKAIAKRWDDISVEDLEIERDDDDEMVVVNCLYRLRHVPDEGAGVVNNNMNSPRDAVLNLIKKIKPDLFVHGVVNGSYNAPFFATRFKEALFHYSSLFDMMEATLPREDQDRMLYEREVYGRDVMNVIACEGVERVERPQTYKQWQVRNQRAGFGQIALAREIVEEVRAKITSDYHNDFVLEEDCGWLLQGWKGRVMYALSCWKPLPQ
ncbi:hypothetical protein C2S52_017129 [Perilla frutescens var. hirtella]|nr:hypothetical protein C2S52_017129 [Perilla frutescens var. hirtella]